MMRVPTVVALATVAVTTGGSAGGRAADCFGLGGTGGQHILTRYCPMWKEPNMTAQCIECVNNHWDKLKQNCTRAQTTKKCQNSPTPAPPPAPLPPLPPDPSAARPHILLWVVDDQGWANVGYHNPGNVHTPMTDEIAMAGVKLDRHYTYRWCAPTRSALMTGRLPYHVFQTTNHVHRGFHMLPAKLKQVGYATHQLGKWHLGNLAPWMTPVGRGYDTSLGYLSGGEDHYTQFQKTANVFGCTGVDLYASDQPAHGQNGSYASFTYARAAVQLLDEHNASVPFFLYMALQVMHAPQQVPEEFSNLYAKVHSPDYAIMNGMASAADAVLDNVTSKLRAKGMWDHLLLIYTSDNGGPAGQLSSGHSGNNFPLRGGKTNLFEGGVRVVAFAGGGFIPRAARGSTLRGYVHVCDWYHTLIKLAGGEPSDDVAGLPPTDSLDMWPWLSGQSVSSPRTQMMLSSEHGVQDASLPKDNDWNGALIVEQYKLILGRQTYGFWQALDYPNATTNHSAEQPVDCGSGGCLFDIIDDPSEYHDLAKKMPDKLAELFALFVKLNDTSFEAARIPTDEQQCEAYVGSHGGFLGPYLKGEDDGEILYEEADALEDFDCTGAHALAVGVGTHANGYAFYTVSTAKECCILCNDDANCGHFVFRSSADVGFELAADAPCHLKPGSASGLAFDCPECTSGGTGVPGASPPIPPPYPPPTPAPKGSPNLLLLFPDEWRYDWAGFEYNHTSSADTRIPLHLPVTASVAARGTRFTQAYVPAPVCAPSRSCLASAREYDAAGVLSNFANDYPASQPTFYGLLRSVGYHTMTTGKDDLTKATQIGSTVDYAGCADCVAGDGRYHLNSLGFSDGLRACGKMDVVNQASPHEMYGYFLRNQSLETEAGQALTGWDGHRACMVTKANKSLCDRDSFPNELYEDDWTASNAIALLRRRPRGKPWMLHVSFPGPHPPFLVTADARGAVAGRYWPQPADNPKNVSTVGGNCNATGEPDGTDVRCNYAAEIENLDALFAHVLAEVDAQGEANNTIVCISSDHGDMLGDHGGAAKSKPWQGSASVPLMCAGPGIAAGKVVTRPVSTLDVAGTFMELGGATPAPNMTTVSLMRLMAEKPTTSPAAASGTASREVDTYRSFVASGLDNWRMVVQQHEPPGLAAVGSYKLICCAGTCPNSPSSTPPPVKGYTLLLIHVEADAFDMIDLSRDPTYALVVGAMLPLLPPPYAEACEGVFSAVTNRKIAG